MAPSDHGKRSIHGSEFEPGGAAIRCWTVIPVLRVLFAIATLVGVAGVIINAWSRDLLDLVLALGLTLLYGVLTVKPDLLSQAGDEDSTSAASMGAQLALLLLFVYLLLSLL